MGKNYRTASPVFVDNKMLKLPYEEMASVIQNKDKNFKEALDQTVSLSGELDANALTQQQDKLGEIFTGYEGRIEEITQAMHDDPMAFSKQLPQLRKLQKELQVDFTRGDVSKIQGNYDTLKEWEKSAKTGVDSKRIQQNVVDYMKNTRLGEFEGVDDEGRVNEFSIEGLNTSVDVQALGKKLASDYKADKIASAWSNKQGDYIHTWKGTETSVDPKIVYEDVYGGLLNNEEFNAYYNQLEEINMVPQGTKKEVAAEEARRAASVYGYTQEDKTSSMKSAGTGGSGSTKKQTDAKDLYNFYTKEGLITPSYGGTLEEMDSKHDQYQNNINKNHQGLVDSLEGLESYKLLKPEQQQVILKGIEEGIVPEDIGLSEATLRNYRIVDQKNKVLKSQNESMRNEFIEDGFKSSETLNKVPETFEEYRDRKNYGDKNVQTVNFSLEDYGFTTKEVKGLKEYVSQNLGDGYLDLSSAPQIVQTLVEQGIIKEGSTSARLEDLAEAGIINPKVENKSKTETVTVDGKPRKDRRSIYDKVMGEEAPGNLPDEEKKVKTNYEVNQTGYEDFEFLPETLGIGNSFDDKGNVNLAMKATLPNGEQILIKYPTSKLGNRKINVNTSNNFQVLTLNEIMVRGQHVSEYKLGEDYMVSRNTEGSQKVYKLQNGKKVQELGSPNNLSLALRQEIASGMFNY